MAIGKVKWFNIEKGFGFIVDESGKDVFVHYSCISGLGFKALQEGEPVTYQLVSGDKGFRARNVERQQLRRPAI